MDKKIYKDVDSFVIVRSKWLRGSEGVLLDDSGKKCCLGFYATSCEIKDEDILGVPSPASLINNKSVIWETKLLELYNNYYRPTGGCRDAILMNDDLGISEADREEDLIDTFNSMGIKLTFVD